MRIDKKPRFRSGLALQLSLHALELFTRFFYRGVEPFDFPAGLFWPDLEVERNEERIDGANRSADRGAGRSHYTVDYSLRPNHGCVSRKPEWLDMIRIHIRCSHPPLPFWLLVSSHVTLRDSYK